MKVVGDKLELHQIRCWCAGAEMRDLLIFSITAYMHATSLDTVRQFNHHKIKILVAIVSIVGCPKQVAHVQNKVNGTSFILHPSQIDVKISLKNKIGYVIFKFKKKSLNRCKIYYCPK